MFDDLCTKQKVNTAATEMSTPKRMPRIMKTYFGTPELEDAVRDSRCSRISSAEMFV